MLPYLKNRMEAAAGSSPMKEPEDDSYGTLEACASDILSAVEKKDHKLLVEALRALVDHIQTMDATQDSTMEETP